MKIVTVQEYHYHHRQTTFYFSIPVRIYRTVRLHDSINTYHIGRQFPQECSLPTSYGYHNLHHHRYEPVRDPKLSRLFFSPLHGKTIYGGICDKTTSNIPVYHSYHTIDDTHKQTHAQTHNPNLITVPGTVINQVSQE